MFQDAGFPAPLGSRWFQEDFGDSDEDVIAHLERYAEPEISVKIKQARKLAGHAYDWSLNDHRRAGL